MNEQPISPEDEAPNKWVLDRIRYSAGKSSVLRHLR